MSCAPLRHSLICQLRADSDRWPAYSQDGYVVCVLQVLDALGWERCVLMGHSMGQGVCSLAAGAAPQRFTAVVLIEGLGWWGGPSTEGKVYKEGGFAGRQSREEE